MTKREKYGGRGRDIWLFLCENEKRGGGLQNMNV